MEHLVFQSLSKPAAYRRVTIIVGIISGDGIFMACDSQNTEESFKHLDVRKLTVVEFENTSALVGESGASEFSGRAVEILAKKAAHTRIQDYRTGSDLAEQAIKEVRALILSNYQAEQFSLEEIQRYIYANCKFSLMLAYYCNDKPEVFTMDNVHQVANRLTQRNYAALGCGADLGNYLLSEHCGPDSDFSTAWATAVYVVEKVKPHINNCDGATRVGVVYRMAEKARQWHAKNLNRHVKEDAWILPDEDVQRVVAKLRNLDADAKAIRNRAVADMIGAIAAEESSASGTASTSQIRLGDY